MQFKRLPLGVYQTNCYVVYDEASKETAIIDPGGDFDTLKRSVESLDLKIKYIILTHGHGDHIGALPELVEYTDAPLCMHENDYEMILSAKKNLSIYMGKAVELNVEQKSLKDGDSLMIGDTKLEIIHTPGHTRGGICIKCEDTIFSGDTLFSLSIGRTDLEGGNFDELEKSIREKLYIYPDDTKVFPGHGSETTIGREKQYNGFVKA